jgi:hypothetical protein
MNDLAPLLEKTLHEEIPLTLEIGITVTSACPQLIELAAPLSHNINHKCTATAAGGKTEQLRQLVRGGGAGGVEYGVCAAKRSRPARAYCDSGRAD